MKLIFSILTVYFLALTVMPCSDDVGADHSRTELTQAEDHGHSDEADYCSPFCFCHCCHSHVNADFSQYRLVELGFFSNEQSTISPSIKDNYPDKLLEPPRA